MNERHEHAKNFLLWMNEAIRGSVVLCVKPRWLEPYPCPKWGDVKRVIEDNDDDPKCEGIYVHAQQGKDDAPGTKWSNHHVQRYRFILLDLDPIEDYNGARMDKAALVSKVDAFLSDLGFPPAGVVDSGNGLLFLIPCDLPPIKDAERAIDRLYTLFHPILEGTGFRIDHACKDPSRIVGLPGTTNRKTITDKETKIETIVSVTERTNLRIPPQDRRVTMDDLLALVPEPKFVPAPPPPKPSSSSSLGPSDADADAYFRGRLFWAIVFKRYPNNLDGVRAALIDAEFTILGDDGAGIFIESPNKESYSKPARDTDLRVHERFSVSAYHDHDKQWIWRSPYEFVERYLPHVWAEYQHELSRPRSSHSLDDLGQWGDPDPFVNDLQCDAPPLSLGTSTAEVDAAGAPAQPSNPIDLPTLQSLPDRDDLYSPSLLALRNRYFIAKTTIPEDQRRYSLMTHSLLGFCKSIAGKRLICSNADTEPIYAGTGATLIASEASVGKTPILKYCQRLYEMITNEMPHNAKSTMHDLLLSICDFRGCLTKDGKYDPQNAKARMQGDQRAFVWLQDEFVRCLQYVVTHWGGNAAAGVGDEDRLNLLIDDGATIGHGSRTTAKCVVYDNCTHILGAMHHATYSQLQPFAGAFFDGGTTARLNVMIDGPNLRQKGLNPYCYSSLDLDDNLYSKTIDALRALWAMAGYVRFEVESGVNPTQMLAEMPQSVSLMRAVPEVYRYLAPKRMRDAVREAMILQVLEDPSILDSSPGQLEIDMDGTVQEGWDSIEDDHPALQRRRTVVLRTDLLKRRLESQALNMANHYQASLLGLAENPYSQKIVDLLRALPDGLSQNDLATKVDPSHRNRFVVKEALDALLGEGQIVIKTPPDGKRGRKGTYYAYAAYAN